MSKHLPIFRVVLIFCFLFAAMTPGAAHASASRAVVRAADLDLASPTDALLLLRRIEAAAARVCDSTLAEHYLSVRRAYRACQRDAIARTVERANAPMLSDVYAARFR